jgi:hypothetical protein
MHYSVYILLESRNRQGRRKGKTEGFIIWKAIISAIESLEYKNGK